MGEKEEEVGAGEQVIDQRISVRDGILEVSKTVLGKEEVSSERIRVRPFLTNVAVISVKAGVTVNLGNYESGRVDVMLSMPCYVQEVEDVYSQVKDWVDKKVAQEYKELNKFSVSSKSEKKQ